MSAEIPPALAHLFEVANRTLAPEPEPPPPPVDVAAILPTVAPTVPPPEPKRRARLYDRGRRGFMRASREEGLADEIKSMTEEARGTPFYADAPPAPVADARARLGMKPAPAKK